MTDPLAIISTIAAAISAGGGAMACVAAYKSAKHAKETFDAAQLSEKRWSLRQLSITAHEVVIQVDRINWVAQGLKSAYSELATHSGQSGGSIEKRLKSEVEVKIEETKPLITKAKSFIEVQTHLLNGPLEEISLREIAITQCLNQAKAIREKLDIELLEIATQNQTRREAVIDKLS